MGGSVYRQIRGIAIGGTGSAQLGNITLYNAEEKGYPAHTPIPLDPPRPPPWGPTRAPI